MKDIIKSSKLPSKAFCALSLSFGFLSGWTNIDNYKWCKNVLSKSSTVQHLSLKVKYPHEWLSLLGRWSPDQESETS